MTERLSLTTGCLLALCLLLVSGLGCTGHGVEPISGHARPKTEHESRSYVTPECPVVRECLAGILGDPPYELTTNGFNAIRNWVAHSVDYQTDLERVGKDDEWQNPKETLLGARVGDCEDFSLLLCSLLRGYGIGPERVFVAVGIDRRENAHAFLIENWYLDGRWRLIEPQAPSHGGHGLARLRSADCRLDRYEIVLAFNDVYYYEGAFPWDGQRTNPGTLSSVLGAIDEAVGRASEGLRHLLGLISGEQRDSG